LFKPKKVATLCELLWKEIEMDGMKNYNTYYVPALLFLLVFRSHWGKNIRSHSDFHLFIPAAINSTHIRSLHAKGEAVNMKLQQ
jgi:hypothetical protein